MVNVYMVFTVNSRFPVVVFFEVMSELFQTNAKAW